MRSIFARLDEKHKWLKNLDENLENSRRKITIKMSLLLFLLILLTSPGANESAIPSPT